MGSKLHDLQRQQRELEEKLKEAAYMEQRDTFTPSAVSATKKKYDTAMKHYFDAVKYQPPREASRSKDGRVVAEPFSFERREATRAKRISQRRFEVELEKREKEDEELRTWAFTASPVPPTTYLEKFSQMVREWEARKANVKEKAMMKAQHLKMVEATSLEGIPVPHSIPRFGREHVTSGPSAALLGGQHPTEGDTSPRRRHARSRSEVALEVERARKYMPFRAKPVPKFVRDHEGFRSKFQAEEKKREEAVKMRADYLLLTSHAPSRMEDAERVRMSAALQGNEKSSAKRSYTPQPRENPFTFQPKINHDTPDFAVEWSLWQNQLLQRQQEARRHTKKKHDAAHTLHHNPYMITNPGGQGGQTITAHYMKPKVDDARFALIQKEALAVPPDHRWPAETLKRPGRRSRSADSARARPASASPVRSFSPNISMTNAHRVRTQRVLLQISERSSALEEEKRLARERRERNREVTKRVAPLVENLNQRNSNEIRAKTAEKRRETVHKTLQYESTIKDMQQKVRARPPIFYEPQHYYDEASRRAAAELQHHNFLKEHGIDMSVMGQVGGKAAAGSHGVVPSTPMPTAQNVTSSGGGITTSATAAAEGPGGAVAVSPVKKRSPSSSSTSSSSAS